jgi:Asp-tRNA(Asn)/Glu-tRNA(Gln) amidotransferase A subunit family amidase
MGHPLEMNDRFGGMMGPPGVPYKEKTMPSDQTSEHALGVRPSISQTGAFKDGNDSPIAFLERCLEVIEAQEDSVGAFVTLNIEGARAAADAATQRWKSGSTLSPIDGMPVGIKDIMETADMATEQGAPLFVGWQGKRDCAAVAALRAAGAVVLGKTVTTEFAASHPSSTRNPWDHSRTPGGSSSGSAAAAVGIGMIPAALGSQVIGSIIRPASFCGCVGFKPSVGGINRGGSFDHFSQSCTGVLGATLADTWTVARAISLRAGGDPGYAGLSGPIELPAASQPRRLVLLQTAGWPEASETAKQALAEARHRLQAAGIDVVDRTSHDATAAVKTAIAGSRELSMSINGWEGHWPLNTYAANMDRSGLSSSAPSSFPRGSLRGFRPWATLDALPSSILRRLSRPRQAARRRAGRRGGTLPRRAGNAASAASRPRRPAGDAGMPPQRCRGLCSCTGGAQMPFVLELIVRIQHKYAKIKE